MLKSKKLLLIALLACIVGSLRAQTDSPYSRYGYGILRDQAVGPSKGMGGTGYGLRNSQSANPLNPASYSRVDSLTFLFDMGIYGTRGKLSEGGNSEEKYSGGLDYITMLVPLKKGLGLSFGILPYSSVGYKYGSTEIDGSLSYVKSFSGSGGLSQVYAGLGYQFPIKGLSLGFNVSYLFGTIDYTRSLPLISGTATNRSYNYTELSVKALKLDLGFQYELPISKDKTLTLGGTFSPKMNSKANYQNLYYEVGPNNNQISGDTTLHNGVDAGLPSTFGLGFMINKKNKLLFGADVTYQKWDGVKYYDDLDGFTQANRFNNKWKYSAGAEYMINPYGGSFIKKMKFRGGINYSNSYLNAINSQGKVDGYNEYGATLGFGFPIKGELGRRVSYINLNFDYKKLKPKISNMIAEEYFGVSMSVNLNEFWFFRRKVE